MKSNIHFIPDENLINKKTYGSVVRHLGLNEVELLSSLIIWFVSLFDMNSNLALFSARCSSFFVSLENRCGQCGGLELL